MKHLQTVSLSAKSIPAKASLLELSQKATISGQFATALNTFAGAIDAFTRIGKPSSGGE